MLSKQTFWSCKSLTSNFLGEFLSSSRLFNEENSQITQSLSDHYSPTSQAEMPLKFGVGNHIKARVDNIIGNRKQM